MLSDTADCVLMRTVNLDSFHFSGPSAWNVAFVESCHIAYVQVMAQDCIV